MSWNEVKEWIDRLRRDGKDDVLRMVSCYAEHQYEAACLEARASVPWHGDADTSKFDRCAEMEDQAIRRAEDG